MGKRAVTLRLTEEETELLRKAGEVLYGREHPVRRATVVRELAKRGARGLVKNERH